ncbi:MAG: bifunctional DNA-formamidopyrimidine glycosylase/DNA-(apurinic or apyrimidinic site) lyase [Candidatus Omnitrophota bacterium]
MPELPEVETIRRDLEKSVLNKTFRNIEIHDPFVLRSPADTFLSTLKGQSVKAIIRRGKALLLQLKNGQYLLVHLMMTGQMVINGTPGKHTRIKFEFSDKTTLLYNDQRRFGQLSVVEDLSGVKYFQVLGPEPLGADFSVQYVLDKTRQSRRPIKSLLLDHTFVAGIGNIYACEILFRCGINPQRRGEQIKLQQAQDIYRDTKEVLKEAIKYRGSSIRNYRDGSGNRGSFKQRIKVYGREQEPCFGCQKPIKRIIQSGRSTFFCAQCQK